MINVKLDSKAKATVSKTAGMTGTSYIAGNGITITEENVINADTKVVVYNGDLTNIPSSILESLNGGDILYAGNAYLVIEKNQFDIIITKVGQNGVDIWTYEKNGDRYEFLRQEQRDIPPYSDPAYLSGDGGEVDLELYDIIKYFHYCETEYGMAISIGWDEEKDTPKLSTVVQDNKYYTVAFTFNEPESEEDDRSVSYVITEHTLGGGVEFVPIDIEATSINLETLEKLVDFNNHTLKPNYIVLTTTDETDTYPILMPSDTLQKVYRSAVMGDKYYQLTLDILEDSADVNIEQISIGSGGGGIDNLCDYYPNLAAINGKQRFNDAYNYYLDVDEFIQYVENSGISDIPFEPDIDDTYPNGIELITSMGGIANGLSVFLQSQTSNSNSYLSIDFAGDMINVEDLINNEGDTLAVFLTRNKNAIKEVFNGNSYSGSNIHNMLDSITNNAMCICRAWERVDTNPTFVHSMNLMKFLELFHR